MIWGRVLDVFRRRRLHADLDSQLAHHLDGLEAEARAQGLSPDDARAAARRAMGGLTQAREAYRDHLTIPLVDTLWQDVRYALRAMRRNLTFTVVVVMTLAHRHRREHGGLQRPQQRPAQAAVVSAV